MNRFAAFDRAIRLPYRTIAENPLSTGFGANEN